MSHPSLDFFEKKHIAQMRKRVAAKKCCAYCEDFNTVNDKHGHYCLQPGEVPGSDGLLYCRLHMAKRRQPTWGVFRSRAFLGGDNLWKDLPTRKLAEHALDTCQRGQELEDAGTSHVGMHSGDTWWIDVLPPKEPEIKETKK